jgi:hypothetical protein
MLYKTKTDAVFVNTARWSHRPVSPITSFKILFAPLPQTGACANGYGA